MGRTRIGVQVTRFGASVGTIDSAARFAVMRACRCPKSTMIERVTFDDAAAVLGISFRQTGKYLYYDVPASVFEAMCHAKSVGIFFNEQIKGRFRCRRDPERRRFGPNADRELAAR